jgi:dethiobiotin synthetase
MPPAARLPPHGFFVTGTDTGVGKTLICCALMHGLAALGKSVIGMKPVAAGATLTPEGWLNDDVASLLAAATVTAPLSTVNPYCFEPAVAPHLAARQAAVEIELDTIERAYDELALRADIVIVEGVGGFCVPLGDDHDSIDLAVRLDLPVILVVGLRLGCLNHALLTQQAIRARGLRLGGWVANRIDPAMALADQNVAALVERLDAPLLGDVDYAPSPDPRRIARGFDLTGLWTPKRT